MIGDEGEDFKATFDTTDVPFPQVKIQDPNNPEKMIVNKSLYSQKFNAPALRYEYGIAIKTNHIVSLRGPFPPGDLNDAMIFKMGLESGEIHLEEGERVIADAIYDKADLCPKYVKCITSVTTDQRDRILFKRAEGRHETFNQRLKSFRCLHNKIGGPTKDKIKKQRAQIYAISTILQVGFSLGTNKLYEI